MDYGLEIWDRLAVFEKKVLNSYDFLDKFLKYLKDRIKIENDYNNSLSKLSKNYSNFISKNKEMLQFSFPQSMNSYVTIGEQISNLHAMSTEEQTKNINKLIDSCQSTYSEQKKIFCEIIKENNRIDDLYKDVDSAKKVFFSKTTDYNNALKAKEEADISPLLNQLEKDKITNVANTKFAILEKARTNYTNMVKNFNTENRKFINETYNSAINKILSLDAAKATTYKEIMMSGLEYFRKMNSMELNCISDIETSLNKITSETDAKVLCDSIKSGIPINYDVTFEEYNENNSKKKREYKITSNSPYDDFNNLVPLQRVNKINTTLTDLMDKLRLHDKEIESLTKMKHLSSKTSNKKKIEDSLKDFNEKKVDVEKKIEFYKDLLNSIQGGSSQSSPNKSSITSKTSSFNENIPSNNLDDFPEPPNIESDRSMFDGKKCRIIFDHTATSENEISVAQDDCCIVMGDDNDGWTLVSKNGSMGYIPTSYMEMI